MEIDVAVKRLRVVEAYQLSQFRNEVNTLKVGPFSKSIRRILYPCKAPVPAMSG